MKKLISIMLVAVMLVSALAVSVSADGVIYMQADFSDDSTFANDFFPEAYFTNDNNAVGYSDARALQTTGSWAAYDVTFDVALDVDEIYTGDERYLSFVYLNNNLIHHGLREDACAMSMCIDIVNKEITLVVDDFVNSDNAYVLAGPYAYEVNDGEYNNFGVSVSEGRIRAFAGETMILEYVDTNDDYYIGYSYEDVEPSILLWWNTGNSAMFSDITVSSPGFIYPIEDEPTPTETEEPTTTEPEATTAIETEIVTNEDGETEVVTHIVTEEKKPVTDDNEADDNGADNKPAPDTNTGKPQGGNSTTTGDISFVVVVAMVTALGAALIVRKVSVK